MFFLKGPFQGVLAQDGTHNSSISPLPQMPWDVTVEFLTDCLWGMILWCKTP